MNSNNTGLALAGRRRSWLVVQLGGLYGLWLREVMRAVRREVGEAVPVFVRLSSTDYIEGGWTIEGTELVFPGGSCARFTPNEVKGEPPVVRVTDTDGTERYAGDGSDVRIEPVGLAAILLIPARKRGERVRGDLRVIIRAGGRADVIDELPLETYLRAVVPREMSPSRPIEALKAQAVAARSYAIDHFRPLDKAWDVHDDGSSQAYGGIDAERPHRINYKKLMR